jgi:membrane protease YdiL (CAAX protease family)
MQDPWNREQPQPQSEGGGVTWGVRDLVTGTAGVLIVFFLLAAAIIYPVVNRYGEDSQEALLASGVTVALWDLAMIIIVFSLVRRRGGGWRDLGFRPPRPRSISPIENRWLAMLALIFVGYFVSIAAVNLYGVIVDWVGLEDLLPGQQISEEYYEHGLPLLVLGLAVVFGAPLAEEVFFRGFLFGGLASRMRFLPAALISGIVFAIAHADPGLIIPFAIVGGVLAYVYRRSGSLYTAIGVHFLFNFVSFMILVFVPEAR